MTLLSLLHRSEGFTDAAPEVVVAALIQMLPEFGCRLVGVEDFGATVRFVCRRLDAITPPVLLAHVRREGAGAMVSLRRASEAFDPLDQARLDAEVGSLLVELAERVQV